RPGSQPDARRASIRLRCCGASSFLSKLEELHRAQVVVPRLVLDPDEAVAPRVPVGQDAVTLAAFQIQPDVCSHAPDELGWALGSLRTGHPVLLGPIACAAGPTRGRGPATSHDRNGTWRLPRWEAEAAWPIWEQCTGDCTKKVQHSCDRSLSPPPAAPHN